jgi:hypothetical protein
MIRFNNLLNKFKTNSKPLLGRWNIEQCNKMVDKKIDWSNEDHCGPCGQNILNKLPKDKNYESKRVK